MVGTKGMPARAQNGPLLCTGGVLVVYHLITDGRSIYYYFDDDEKIYYQVEDIDI